LEACSAHWAGVAADSVSDVHVYVQQLQRLQPCTLDMFVQRTIMCRCMVSTDVTRET